MFRSHTDTVRKPIESDKSKTELKTRAVSLGYKCDMCDETWLTETDVDIHRKKVHLPEIISLIRNEKEHFCLTCVRPQGSAEKLLSHIKSEHLMSSPAAQRVEREIFICDRCENVFFNKRLLLSHIQYIHRSKLNNDSIIPCPKCSKSFKCNKMWFHFNFHQLNINSTCQICLTHCQCRSQQREHLKTHLGYYHCSICNITMNKKQFFDEHIATHKKRTPHPVAGDLRRFFAPWSAVAPWKYRIGSGIKGIHVYDLSICILCREICTTTAEKRRHIMVDHAPEMEVKQKPMCVCGEEFFNTVLLKHHVFKLKGNHRILGDNEVPRQLVGELFQEGSPVECGESVVENPSDHQGLFEDTSPMDCDLFTVQDLESPNDHHEAP